MKLARTLRLDESDTYVFDSAAEAGEWAIPGGFAFSNWTEEDLKGKARQAFANGWLGLETFGRVTFVAVTQIEPSEFDALADTLAQHFVTIYGAPSLEQARPVALEELHHMADMCEDHDSNTLLTVARELTESGVKEAYRVIEPQGAELDQFAIHSTPEE